MYTIIMTEDKYLYPSIGVRPIYKNEQRATVLRILIPSLEQVDLKECTVAVIYITPDDNRVCKIITPEENLYKGKLDYRFELTKDITAISGIYTFHLKILKQSELPENEISITTSNCTFEVIDNYGPSDSKDPNVLAKRIDILENELEKVKTENAGKGDDIEIIDGEIWLMSGGKKIGDPIPGSSHGITVFKREDTNG